jgi:pseudaminic acid cytidylyltransferase
MNIAIIPARGGSKRILKKNIREFNNKPIIAWSIQAALESGCFDRVIVSTDSKEIASTAKLFGAEVPFLRDKNLSDDHTPTLPVISDAISQLEDEIEFACCIYPTAPFVKPDDISKGLKIIMEQKVDFVFTATKYNYPIQRALRLDQDGTVSMLQPDQENVRSQDLEDTFHDAGQFYWGVSDAWLEGRPILNNSCILEVLESHSQDIDTEDDWRKAEIKFRLLQLEEC